MHFSSAQFVFVLRFQDFGHKTFKSVLVKDKNEWKIGRVISYGYGSIATVSVRNDNFDPLLSFKTHRVLTIHDPDDIMKRTVEKDIDLILMPWVRMP